MRPRLNNGQKLRVLAYYRSGLAPAYIARRMAIPLHQVAYALKVSQRETQPNSSGVTKTPYEN